MTTTSQPVDPPRTVPHADVLAAAERLSAAARRHRPCPPVRDLLGTTDVAAAYLAQQIGTDERVTHGARIVGRKIGLTSPAVQRQLGVDRPDFGVLFADMLCPLGAPVPTARLLQPKAEAEVAFVLQTAITEPVHHAARLAPSIDYAVAAIEIVDSRIAGWDITITDTIADNASSGLFVLGERPVSLADVNPVEVEMTLRRNGEVVSTGSGRDCLGDPLRALAWLANTALELGTPLRAGDIVLSGALGPMVAVTAGDTVVADITGLGQVSATFAGAEVTPS